VSVYDVCFGMALIPVLWVTWDAAWVVGWSVRDTGRLFWGELKPGYRRWSVLPYLPRMFWLQLKEQCRAYWNGYRTEIQPGRKVR
jgi:hypothetical protein